MPGTPHPLIMHVVLSSFERLSSAAMFWSQFTVEKWREAQRLEGEDACQSQVRVQVTEPGGSEAETLLEPPGEPGSSRATAARQTAPQLWGVRPAGLPHSGARLPGSGMTAE